jgi:hypothetical protein
MNIMLCHCFFIFLVASFIQDVLRKALGHVASRHYAMLGIMRLTEFQRMTH